MEESNWLYTTEHKYETSLRIEYNRKLMQKIKNKISKLQKNNDYFLVKSTNFVIIRNGSQHNMHAVYITN